jgi:ATP-dependent DNA helicase RecG
VNLSSIPDIASKNRIAALEASKINTLWDLLLHLPYKWRDERNIKKISEAKAGDWVVLAGDIIDSKPRKGTRPFCATLQDSSGKIDLVFFSEKSAWKSLRIGTYRLVIGEVKIYNGSLQMQHPEVRFLGKNEVYNGSIISIYPKTKFMEKKINDKIFAKVYKFLFEKNLSLVLPPEENICPPELLKFLKIRHILDILKSLHCPQTIEEANVALRENKILTLLPFCLRMARRRMLLANSGIPRKLDSQKMEFVKNNLPFALTSGQNQALEQIKNGLESNRQFHALLQGDVGSGKTVVAMLAMIGICGAGGQAACMVPTDILARQHFSGMEAIFKYAGLHLALLVGALGTAERREVLEGLKNGEINAVIGTHALFSKDTEFCNLEFVIIDEQHRFGVKQREALLAKGNKTDLLVMSATPIPRSLAMTFYGDLEAIILREKPPGRMPVRTELRGNLVREKIKDYLYKKSFVDNRCYWVVSRVQEDEFGETACVANIYNELKKFKQDWKIAVVHGQMPEAERTANLNTFARGEISLLVCTTVVEVGVNVPEANLMVIDKPESFGLAQLHQLRGRIGRGNVKALCILLCEEDNNSDAYKRLLKFSMTNDGFEIAELDLQNRGAGNLEGSEQSGLWILRQFDWIQDRQLIEKIINTANRILNNEPDFSQETLQKIQNWYNDKKFEKIEDGVH